MNGEAILGYYNNYIHHANYGKPAYFIMSDVLEIGKKYRLQFDVVEHSGLQHEEFMVNQLVIIDNSIDGSNIWNGVYPGASRFDGRHVNVEWVANRTDFRLIQGQVNSPAYYYDGILGSTTTTVQEWVNAARIADDPTVDGDNDGIPDGNDYGNHAWLYGGIVRIKNLIVEEVKEDLKIIGSYDDRQEEYNITIHGTDSKTASFKEDVKGWVSFK